MARPRKTSTTAEPEVPTQQQTEKKGMRMPLSPDQIKAIYAKRRTKGLYSDLWAEFMASDEAGVSVRENWPTQFAWDPEKPEGERGKQATTLKQGFENWKKNKDAPEGSELIDIIVDGDEVYLINRRLTEGLEVAELVEA